MKSKIISDGKKPSDENKTKSTKNVSDSKEQ